MYARASSAEGEPFVMVRVKVTVRVRIRIRVRVRVGVRVRVRVAARVRVRVRDRDGNRVRVPNLARGEEEAADPQHGEAVAEGDGQVAVEHARQGRSHAAGDDLEPHSPAHGGARGQRAVGDPGEQRELERVRLGLGLG